MLTIIMSLAISSASAYSENVYLTGYSHTGNVMANGEYPYVGCIATNDYPIGTTVYIFGKPYVVKDRMAVGIHGAIDIFMSSHEEAINFGRQYATVEVLP